ncbi:hypothetical protein JAAARDRAFT_208414 [Jaapia argillacea MUCL 33604]|uniref:F-box domain-containing protein n=1 Tax=Jaapia argillacea MUCL 33604 TaxID=933084 RepID=A0A067PZ18_9AGAM|nr:hypothetical protein JAAARDRAFT_208414 [Jaapia argillacea MUCL 33604]
MSENATGLGASKVVLQSNVVILQVPLAERHIHIPGVCRLPPELLRKIFQLVLPLECVIDRHFPNCIPLCIAPRDEQYLVLVCRNWMWIGIELLYEHITIHRAIQIPMLIRTLHANSGLGSLVRTLSLSFSISFFWREIIINDISTLVSHCPRIRRVILSPSWDLAFSSGLRPSLTSGIDINSITHLETKWDMAPVIIDTVLDSCCNFRSLVLTIPPSSPRPIRLPRLENLHLALMRPEEGGFSALATWSMPRLTSLTLAEYDAVPESSLKSFLTLHGVRLKFLHFRDDMFCPEDLDRETLATTCPQLQHLVMPSTFTWSICHPSLMSLDVWTFWTPEICNLKDTTVAHLRHPGSLPDLRQVRRLDTLLLCIRDLPQIFPPESVSDDTIIKHELVGLEVLQTKSCLVLNIPGRRHEFELDSDSDSRYGLDGVPSESDEIDYYASLAPFSDEVLPSANELPDGSTFRWEDESITSDADTADDDEFASALEVDSDTDPRRAGSVSSYEIDYNASLLDRRLADEEGAPGSPFESGISDYLWEGEGIDFAEDIADEINEGNGL